jgi:hypothetical protein
MDGCRVRLLVPRVEQLHAQRLEVSDVAGDDDEIEAEGGRRYQDVSFRSWIRDWDGC